MGKKDLYEKLNLKWYVLLHNFNNDKIVHYNIFNNGNVWNERIGLPKILKKYVSFEEFKEDLELIFKYSFQSKMEYEIYASGVSARSETYKLDVWYQIEPNLDLIARYIIEKYNKHKRNKLCI